MKDPLITWQSQISEVTGRGCRNAFKRKRGIRERKVADDDANGLLIKASQRSTVGNAEKWKPSA